MTLCLKKNTPNIDTYIIRQKIRQYVWQNIRNNIWQRVRHNVAMLDNSIVKK